jgi:hypothetical protein
MSRLRMLGAITLFPYVFIVKVKGKVIPITGLRSP